MDNILFAVLTVPGAVMAKSLVAFVRAKLTRFRRT
jgi:hypothetical protein